ncbi:hypothetical protein PENCOP_c013G07368 [Penicillium coprophilum]|uniref:Uncharacterized protein n=1 Tax=Penicillium coprophilum TaxID=36646 RepID=A0A1V6UAA6_9EURO|nr:hypothetical protein PENCOP_c013G07368 [Penicillium coprophilum]
MASIASQIARPSIRHFSAHRPRPDSRAARAVAMGCISPSYGRLGILTGNVGAGADTGHSGRDMMHYEELGIRRLDSLLASTMGR